MQWGLITIMVILGCISCSLKAGEIEATYYNHWQEGNSITCGYEIGGYSYYKAIPLGETCPTTIEINL